MLIEDAKEYHPYAACLMFKGCRDSEKVRANLAGVIAHGVQYHSGFDDMADRIAQLEARVKTQEDVIAIDIREYTKLEELNEQLKAENAQVRQWYSEVISSLAPERLSSLPVENEVAK